MLICGLLTILLILNGVLLKSKVVNNEGRQGQECVSQIVILDIILVQQFWSNDPIV